MPLSDIPWTHRSYPLPEGERENATAKPQRSPQSPGQYVVPDHFDPKKTRTFSDPVEALEFALQLLKNYAFNIRHEE